MRRAHTSHRSHAPRTSDRAARRAQENAHYALPRCAEIDSDVPYAARACSKQERGRGIGQARGKLKKKPLPPVPF